MRRRELSGLNILPSEVRVGPHVIPVRRNTEPGDNEMYGYFRQTDVGAEIVLDERCKGHRELAVFFHELSHAISDTYGLGLEHKQVYGLGEGLAQAIGPYFKLDRLLRMSGTSRRKSAARLRKQNGAARVSAAAVVERQGPSREARVSAAAARRRKRRAS